MSEKAHSLWGPSSAHRWMDCPASAARSRNMKEEESEYAKEGTKAHDLAFKILTNAPYDPEDYDTEMIAEVNKYVDQIRVLFKGASFTAFELPVDLSKVLGIPDTFGTSDASGIVGKTLIVGDFKYGKGDRVKVRNNPQLLLYALGVLDLIGMAGYEVDTISLWILQPRLDHFDNDIIPIAELEGFREVAKAQAAISRDLYLKAMKGEEIPSGAYAPGVKQCKYCPAKGECEAQSNYVQDSIRMQFDALPAESDNPTELGAHFSKALKVIDAFHDWSKAIQERAQAFVKSGGRIPGYKLVQGRAGNRKWDDEYEVERILNKEARLSKPQIMNMKLKSPAAIEKLLAKRPKIWDRVNEHITQEPGSPTLAEDTDKRPALVLANTADDFEKLDDKTDE